MPSELVQSSQLELDPMRDEAGRVAVALRRLKSPPNAFLFLDGGDWTWDTDSIFNIPVFHVNINLVAGIVVGEANCRWIPIYSDDRENDGWKFERFYDEQ